MRIDYLRLVNEFFTCRRFSEKGRCFIAEKYFADGRELCFYAKGTNADDLVLLVRSIHAFHHLTRHWDDYIKLICADLDKRCPDYFDGIPALGVLRTALKLVSFDVESMDFARVTFGNAPFQG